MTNIQEIYIAVFGRPADPAGLQYWNNQLAAGSDMATVAGLITLQPEFQNVFNGLTGTQMVTAIFQNLFGRAPDAAGLDFYLDALASGQASSATMAAQILDAARGGDLAVLKAKVAAADLFTGHLDGQHLYQGAEAAIVGRAFLSAVTAASNVSEAATAAAIARLPTGAQFPGDDGAGQPEGMDYALNALITPYKTVAGKEMLLIGEGSAGGFAVATSHSAHLELGISVRDSAGAVLSSAGYAEGHTAGFSGADAGDTVLALSITALAQTELTQFGFRLSIDTDPSAAVSMQHYLLQGNADTGYLWALDANGDGIANGAGDAVHQSVAVSQAQGHFMFLDMFALADRSGIIDVRLEAMQGSSMLADTAVRIDFANAVSVVGLSPAPAELHG